jgi:hypothetical protein
MSDIITGQEVIGVAGQNLDRRELRFLVGLADGESTATTAQAIGVKVDEMPFVEVAIRGKLGARNKAHMLARAFTLGVLKARALIIAFLVVLAVVGTTSAAYYTTRQIPTTSKAMEYDIMAGGSGGAATQDPRYLDLINKRLHPRG